MNHSLKIKLREMQNHSVILSKVYHKAAAIKTRRLMKLSDEEFIRQKFKENVGYELNLDDPQTFNEKLQWLKLYDRKPIYTIMADKYRAREYIKESVGEEYVVPLYGVWHNIDDINFDRLPERFVIKCNHDCGGLSICRDKKKFDFEAARKKLGKSLSTNYYNVGREWQYKDITPVILAEELLENNDGSPLVEYDFWCFNGKVKLVSCGWGDRDKGDVHYNDFYDADFNRLEISCNYPKSDRILKKPEMFDKMKEIAETLAGERAFLRVDIYICNDKPFIGELTFHHWGGMGLFKPSEWDRTLGSWLVLPEAANHPDESGLN